MVNSLEPQDEACHWDGFVSLRAMYIFVLINLDGRVRQEMLEIFPLHYKSKKIAYKWYTDILLVLNPDIYIDDKTTMACDNLEEIYKAMVKYGK